MSSQFVAGKETRSAKRSQRLRSSNYDHDMISYVYVVGQPDRVLRAWSISASWSSRRRLPLGEAMVAPVVAAESDDVREDLEELFAKYHYR